MNKYIRNSIVEILEILDGMSYDEVAEVLEEINNVIQDDGNFNGECFDVTLCTYRKQLGNFNWDFSVLNNSGDKND